MSSPPPNDECTDECAGAAARWPAPFEDSDLDDPDNLWTADYE